MSTQPQIVAAPGAYTITWPLPDEEIVFDADRLRDHNGSLDARVRIVLTRPPEDPRSVHHGNLNLRAGRSRKGLSRDLDRTERLKTASWDQIIEDSCRLILEREEREAPVEHLVPVDSLEVEYLLDPLLLDHLQVVWYAPGGSGKSLLAMYVALLVQNGLSLQGGTGRQANVLYLDWEVTQEEASRRCTLLANGLGHARIGAALDFPLYRRCLGSILDEASEIAKNVASHDIGLVIVDSAGPACGGDIMSGELAIQFFNTLRKVTASTKAAVGILTHTTKADRREENQRRLPIGSIYFENLARATWEIRPQETAESKTLRLGVFPRKQNMARPEALGLKLTFGPGGILVDTAAVSDVSTEQGATQSMIRSELERGPLSVQQLVEATGASSGTVRTLLWKLKERGQVANPKRGLWSLAGEGER